MINFACKVIDFDQILTCAFSMNKTEYSLFLFLDTQSEPLCVNTISEMMKKDRTTIQKAIKSMAQKNLVTKHQVNLEKGGYTFVYALKDKPYLKAQMLKSVNSWTESVINRINKW
jgi:predicted transcriptional regulator